MDTSIWNERETFKPFADFINLSENCFGTIAMLELYSPTLTLDEFRERFPNYHFREGERVDLLHIRTVITVWK